MSETTLSDIDFKNKMARTTLNFRTTLNLRASITYRRDHNSNTFDRYFCGFIQFTICNNFSHLNLNQNIVHSRIFVRLLLNLSVRRRSSGPSTWKNFFNSKWVIGQWLENFWRLSEFSLGRTFATKMSHRALTVKNRYFGALVIFGLSYQSLSARTAGSPFPADYFYRFLR